LIVVIVTKIDITVNQKRKTKIETDTDQFIIETDTGQLKPVTCPCTTSPVSLTNLQVAVGGQNVLQSTLQYGYEHFLEQVNLCGQLTSSDFGISTGLINLNYWENSKWYYVNVERGNAADKLNGRNINVSFTNKSNVPIEAMIFIFYSDEIAIDVKTGLVTRHKN
jgi:hypothetical protein